MGEGQYTERINERFLGEVAPPEGQRVLLYDFDTGRPELLPRHREGLDRHVIPRLAANAAPTAVWIGGLASRRGDEELNEALGFARAMAVEQYILRAAPELAAFVRRHSLTTQYFGERYSAHHTENSEYYRSVLVVMRTLPRYEPPPRREPRARIFATNRFKIQLSWGFDGGEILAFSSSTFVIDYDDHVDGAPASDPIAYKLRAGGFGGGPTPVGGSTGDPTLWNRFTAPAVLTTRGFEGWARLSGWNASLHQGLGRTHLRLIPDACDDILIENVQSASSFGVGGAIVQGPFTIDEESTRDRQAGRGPR